ncbi:MMPL family transporter [Streptomyces fuscichromogenes]|uniref:Membrane protein n=1 Tax=Streptomyces fuscichromogenes TaxID=1324013 RepID=A0A917XFI6_9ACTN|nr:MMPL family transporter [Streptomyces fuscichromogenes]GGN19566.1 membrane protein [Streptomyces fuscichromogenes]
MAKYLYRLGRFAFRRRRVVVAFWLVLLALTGAAAASASTPKATSFSLPGTESQNAFDLLSQRFPGSYADGATARVVFKAPDGEKITDASNKADVEKVVAGLKDSSPQVARVVDPFAAQAVSRDGTAAYIQVSYKVPAFELDDSVPDKVFAIADHARQQGLTVEAGGDALREKTHTGATELIGVGVAAVTLFITFGSLVAAGLPLLTALTGVGIGVAGIIALANTLDLGSTTSVLATMLGLAVAIDYALFIVSRYRTELAHTDDREHAVGRAVGTAGSAVVFAGLTVIIALAGLAVVNVPPLTKMGLAAAATVALSVVIAITMIPALIGFAGHRLLPRKAREAATTDGNRPNLGTRWARFVLRRPVTVLLVAMVGLGVVAVPATSMELALPDDGSQPTSTTQRKAYDLLSEEFGPGVNGPLIVVVDGKSASGGVKAVTTDTAAKIRALDGVASVLPSTVNATGTTAIIPVVPKTGPGDEATKDLVHAIRDTGSGIKADTEATVYVTGRAAMNIDFSQRMSDVLLPYLALVVGLAFILLIVVFRSLLVPLKAALGFLFSVAASLGAVVAVFQWGWLAGLFGVEEPGPVMSMMPIFLVGVVFGLAMDYEVFLVTRMREAYVHGEGPGQAVITGFQHGARVVTAAATIMIAVFAGFIGATDSMVKMIGFGLAVAVFLDAFVVRMTIVPAVLALLGKRAWWLPRWLDRALPDVDIEGAGLTTEPAPPLTDKPRQSASA